MDNQYYIYMLSSKPNGILYIGVTNNLIRRVYEHKRDLVDGFSKKYHTHNLVYFETTSDVKSAIAREKQMKKWRRDWKIEVIIATNPQWRDLYNEIILY